MGKGLWERAWVRHVAVALGYSVSYVIFRQFSQAHWQITAGLRLTVLLLAPYRYWPALIVGEFAYYGAVGYICSAVWGVAWGLACAIPVIAYVAPVVYWVRKHWSPVLRNANHINMVRLLGCALLSSIPLTLRDLSLFLVIKNLPADYVVNYYDLALHYCIGGFLGVLTVTPLALFGYQKLIVGSWSEVKDQLENSRLFFESICLGLPVLAFLLWVGFNAPPHASARQMAQVAMFLPVVWLALRHGWQGAAIGGAAASCAVMLLMPSFWDPATMQAESILAFAISTMLLMGARIDSINTPVEQERVDVRVALALAQRSIYLGEMQMRMTSQALEQVREGIQAGFTMMMGRLRHLQPAIDDRGYQRHAQVAQDQILRLAESLYPVALREKGLPGVLREGGLSQMLNDAGLTYVCDLRGPISKLSHALRMTIYRVLWETVADACTKKNVSDVRAYVRVAERQGRIGVLVIVRFRMRPAQLAFVDWDELVPSMARATSGLGLRAVRDRAAVFEGCVRTRSLDSGHQVSVLLLDPAVPGVAIGFAGMKAEC